MQAATISNSQAIFPLLLLLLYIAATTLLPEYLETTANCSKQGDDGILQRLSMDVRVDGRTKFYVGSIWFQHSR